MIREIDSIEISGATCFLLLRMMQRKLKYNVVMSSIPNAGCLKKKKHAKIVMNIFRSIH